MGRGKALLTAALAIGVSSAAGADELLPPAPSLDALAVDDNFSGWYLRGDIGLGAAQITGWRPTFETQLYAPAYATLGDQGVVGGGFGYRLSDWFRADLTGEYRSEASYRAGVLYAAPGQAGLTPNAGVYSAGLNAAVFMGNAYLDLGEWRGVTPYLGAGVGLAAQSLAGLANASTVGVAPGANRANFAWAVMGGLSFDANSNLKIELGYRYLDMGSLSSHLILCADLSRCSYDAHSFHAVSHDVRLSFRYALSEGEAPKPASPALRPLEGQ